MDSASVVRLPSRPFPWSLILSKNILVTYHFSCLFFKQSLLLCHRTRQETFGLGTLERKYCFEFNTFCIFLKFICFTWKIVRVTETEEGQKKIIHTWIAPQNGHNGYPWASPKLRTKDLNNRLLFSHTIKRELDWKWDNQDLNWCSYGMLTL